MNAPIVSPTDPRPLTISRSALALLIKLNVLMGFLIFALLIASLIAGGPVMRALGVKSGDGSATLTLGLRAIMVIGICAVPLTHIVLTRLLEIVETVRAGDPFVARNAHRLQTIAWSVLGLELMHLIVGAVAAQASTPTQPLDIDWNFSVTRSLAVLLLFVLARVFDHGTRMRDELAATV